MTDTQKVQKAKRSGRRALADIATALDVPYVRGRDLIECGAGAVLRMQPEQPGGRPNGHVRFVLLRNGISQRQFPETADGVAVQEIVEVTRERLKNWRAEDTAAKARAKREEEMVRLAERYTDRASEVGATLVATENAIQVQYMVTDEAELREALQALRG